MKKSSIAFAFAVSMIAFTANARDLSVDLDFLPFDLGFQLGFTTRVVPGPGDMSHHLGLHVAADRIYSDKRQSMVVTGTITNFGTVARDNISMHFAVDSYVGTGTSRATAMVEPNYLAPGYTASFVARIRLDSEKPRYAMFTVTAGGGIETGESIEYVYPDAVLEYVDPETVADIAEDVIEPYEVVEEITEP